jgi:high-affinity iron transporter
MLQPFIIILREGFESFLLVAVILAYLRKSGQRSLVPAVYVAIIASLFASMALGYVLMQGVNQSLWEGVLGVVAIVMVASLVIHMWRTAPKLREKMDQRLSEASTDKSRLAAFGGVFLFTALMITREGMETALMLLQLRNNPRMIGGALLGLVAAAALAWSWARFGHLINLKRFFQVTGIFLLLFMVQVGIYSFHEFSEAGVLPNSDFLHEATEKFSPDGLYGKWFSLLMISVCAFWLLVGWVKDRLKPGHGNAVSLGQT